MSLNNQETLSWEPKIIAFCCNWCSYAGADFAGLSRLQYPANVRIVRVPCSGRVNPQFVLRALQWGADGVLVAGCHPGDCHYVSGNYFARRRFLLMQRLLEYVGLERERLQIHWISGSEGARFAGVVAQMVEEILALGPNKRLMQGYGPGRLHQVVQLPVRQSHGRARDQDARCTLPGYALSSGNAFF